MKRTDYNDKSKPGTAFKIFIPIQFDLSLPVKIQTKLKEKYSKFGSISNNFRIRMFKILDVKNEKQLLEKYPKIKRKAKELKREIKDQLGVEDREFSQLAKEWAEELVK